jgi:hypothetical protein
MVELDPNRPLIISDADEVLLRFIASFERYLERRSCYLDLKSFRIHGNIKRMPSGEAVPDEQVTELIASFFASETRTMDVVAGAADALAKLSRHAQIVILTNLPDTARDARIENLAGHGISYPLIVGTGPKGHFVKQIIEGHKKPIVFIDDLPHQIASVAAETPHVHRLHFIAEPRLARLLPKGPDAHARIDAWPEAEAWIASVIEEH